MKQDKEPDARKKSDKRTDPPKPRRIYARPPIDGTEEELVAWAQAFYEALMGTKQDKPRDSSKNEDTP